MNQHHPANFAFHAINAMAAPLDALEAEARASRWRSAERGSLYVLCRTDGSFSYQWGDASISRREAALRAQGRACGEAS
jgi:hypothetical protein